MDWIRSDRLASSTGEHSTRLAGHVSARQDQYVERIEVHIGGTVLQQAENRVTASVERHHLSVDYSFIRQLLQCCHNAGIAFSEVLVVAGPEPDLAAALDRQRPIAVGLDLILPAVALGQLVGPQQEHRSINRAVRSALGTIKGRHNWAREARMSGRKGVCRSCKMIVNSLSKAFSRLQSGAILFFAR